MADATLAVAGRHLVTTADARSWKLDRPVLFLGEWCRLYSRRELWLPLDAELAAPFGIGPGEKVRDIECVKRIAAAVLPELADALNQFHGVEHSVRYWQILLGHWLLRCVSVVFNRYHTLEAALRNYRVSGTTIFESPNYTLATSDSLAFIWACGDDLWNHVLYARVLDFIGGVQQDRITEPLHGIAGFALATAQNGSVRNLAQHVAGVAKAVLKKLSREHDAVMLSTYLPLRERLKLELSLGQSPQVWRTPPLRVVEPDVQARRSLTLDAGQHEGLDRFLRLHLHELIPTCYLEGYASLKAQVGSLGWPAAPEFIYTANNFDSDEIFKAWTAEHVERGIRYITGQHGNNYGTHIWAGAEFWPERAAADEFVTWGWTSDDPRDVPAFLFRTAGRGPQRGKRDGGLLLIEMPVSHRIDPHDSYAEFATYQADQFRFVEALPTNIRRALTVRLHGEYRKFPWREDDRWRDRLADVRIELGQLPINKLIEASRLVVHSYDSTGILEALALDTPMMCFWNGGLEHLQPSAKPYYELLRDAGMLHDSPDEAAAAVGRHWDDVQAWWQTSAVKKARLRFSDRYARTVPRPYRTLKEILRGHSADVSRPRS